MPIPYHPLANIFPLIEGEEFEAFCESFRKDGFDQHQEIVRHEGYILDGRNRQRACDATGVKPLYRDFDPNTEGDPVDFVIRMNLPRRHLDESQRAACAAELATMRQGERTDIEPSANLQKVAQGKAAERFNVSTRLVADAAKVKKAAPDVFHAVKQGALPASTAAKLVDLPPDDQKKVISSPEPAKTARNEIARHNRDERLDEIIRANGSAAPALVARRKYSIIYADPPWRFDVWSRETGLEKSPDRHYPTLTVEQICALPVSDLVASAALLFLWITVPLLNRMDDVFRAWGRIVCEDSDYGVIKQPWTYVSNYAWDKVDIGPGRWNRNQHEHLLIARIGDVPAPLPSELVRSLYSEKSTAHSAKPDYFAALIEKNYPGVPKIELFRRGEAREGWHVWGNEAVSADASVSWNDDGFNRQPERPASTNVVDFPDRHDEILEIPAFLRIGHPECIRRKT